MPIIARSDFRKAIDNIARWGDTDIFPRPVDNYVFYDMPDRVVDLLDDIASRFDSEINRISVDSYSTLAPVGYTGFRWATQIDPMWNAYLLGLVVSLALQIERERLSEDSNRVFSYRYRETATDSSLFASDGWHKFQEATRQEAESHDYVVSVDIGDFYARIYHHRLENALLAVDNGGGARSKQIMAILTRLSGGTSYGLPVGGPAARILSELVLNRVDHLIVSQSTVRSFCRYADDYRFFVEDVHAAYKAVGLLSEKLLRNEGLTLQKSKTRIMKASEYLSILDPPDPPRGSAAAFLSLHIHYDPYSATAVQDYERLKGQLGQFDILSLLRDELSKSRIHSALTRRLVQAIQYMDSLPRQQAILSLLENIEVLAPVIPQVMLAIKDSIADLEPDFIDRVHAVIRGLIEEQHYVAQVDLNLAFMIRVMSVRHSIENELLLIRLYQSPNSFGSGFAPYIQRDIMLILARWRVTYWLSDQKNYISNAHAWVKRAFVIASYTLGDEGRHWRRGASMRAMGPFEQLVKDWAASRWQPDGSWPVPI
jgi:hypothetical protein